MYLFAYGQKVFLLTQIKVELSYLENCIWRFFSF